MPRLPSFQLRVPRAHVLIALVAASVGWQASHAEDEDLVVLGVPIARIAYDAMSKRELYRSRKELLEDRFTYDGENRFHPTSPEVLQLNCSEVRQLGVWFALVAPLSDIRMAGLEPTFIWSFKNGADEVVIDKHKHLLVFASGSNRKITRESIKLSRKQKKNGLFTLTVLNEGKTLFRTKFALKGCDSRD